MTSTPRDRHRRVGELFAAATKLDPDRRAAYLDEACGADAALRAEVDALLAHDGAELVEAVGAAALGALASEAARPTPARARVGGFRIRSVLGSGGMGVVYEAEQENPRRTVALKVIRNGFLTPKAWRRFEHEVQVLGLLNHRGVAQIFEAGTAEAEDGTGPEPYFAMELIRGPRSRPRSRSRGSFEGWLKARVEGYVERTLRGVLRGG
jgi:hypothetical protein